MTLSIHLDDEGEELARDLRAEDDQGIASNRSPESEFRSGTELSIRFGF